MLTFYYALGACSLASHIALEEAGAEYESVRISTREGDARRPEFRAVNPKGRVPALLTERGLLSENPAILAYVAQTWPQARLAPIDDPFAFGQAQAFNSYLCATVHVAYAHGKRGYRWADDPAARAELARKVPETMGACFELIEEEMLAGPWVLGEAYSICDPYLFTLSDWLEDVGIERARFPKVADHHARMLLRPAVQRVLAREREQPGLFDGAGAAPPIG
ncbi:MAG: glutathione S-transferase [Caulobacter sp.]|nr:glutathione S-transferase [Caulobacter sp.]